MRPTIIPHVSAAAFPNRTLEILPNSGETVRLTISHADSGRLTILVPLDALLEALGAERRPEQCGSTPASLLLPGTYRCTLPVGHSGEHRDGDRAGWLEGEPPGAEATTEYRARFSYPPSILGPTPDSFGPSRATLDDALADRVPRSEETHGWHAGVQAREVTAWTGVGR